MTKMLLSIIAALIAPLFFTTIGFAQNAQPNSITGFTFQDNNVNGAFDDGDNTFPAAVVYIEPTDGGLVRTVQVTPNGYFVVEGLAATNYIVWAQYLDRVSAEQLVQLGNLRTHANVIIGIESHIAPDEETAVLTRSTDSESAFHESKRVLLPIIIR